MHTMVRTFKNYLTIFDVLHASLSPKFNRKMVFKAGAGAGRSGSFFFYSHDRKFIVKTMTKPELKLFLKILPALAEHHTNTPQSLLAKIFGVFTVKMRQAAPVHLMLMENVLRLKNKDNLKYIFDLKGSLVDRKVKGVTEASTTLKDVNFLMAAKTNKHLTVMSQVNKLVLRDAIRKDVAFLQGQGLMDYSLLLGIETMLRGEATDQIVHQIGAPRFSISLSKSSTSNQKTEQSSDNEAVNAKTGLLAQVEELEVTDVGELMSRMHCFVKGRRVYHVAIIDYLQEWNIDKKLERFTKTVLLNKDAGLLSAIEPQTYA
mmetsp:Transcript_3020/g.4094  ORF Transcript_3020/g.4094 Transcript_3020/m.4094 type:complete len:317 (-) Transcript_3020:75-1025(-)